MKRIKTLTIVAALCVLGTMAVGQSPETPADQAARLQAENRLLRAQVERLSRELAEVKAQLEAARQKATSQPTAEPDSRPVTDAQATSQPAQELSGRFAVGQVGTLRPAKVLRVIDRQTLLVECTVAVKRFNMPSVPLSDQATMAQTHTFEKAKLLVKCPTGTVAAGRMAEFEGTFRIDREQKLGPETVFVAEPVGEVTARLFKGR